TATSPYLASPPSSSTKYQPTRALARAFLRSASLTSYQMVNVETEEERHLKALVKDVEGWAMRFLTKTGDWNKRDLDVFMSKVLRDVRKGEDGGKEGLLDDEVGREEEE